MNNLQAMQILDNSSAFKHHDKFLKNMEQKMAPLSKLVQDISKFEHHQTLPCTWTDINENTCYFE